MQTFDADTVLLKFTLYAIDWCACIHVRPAYLYVPQAQIVNEAYHNVNVWIDVLEVEVAENGHTRRSEAL